MTPAEIVLDASALVRGLLREAGGATAIVGRVGTGVVRAHAPDLITAETANALVRLVRAGRLSPQGAAETLDAADVTAIVSHASAAHSRQALERALADGLSAYDALYAVLAEALEVPLVTADRRLADAVPGSLLVT